jgi:hypothetical protein
LSVAVEGKIAGLHRRIDNQLDVRKQHDVRLTWVEQRLGLSKAAWSISCRHKRDHRPKRASLRLPRFRPPTQRAGKGREERERENASQGRIREA